MGYGLLMAKAPVVAGAFFDSLISLAGWGELTRHLDLFDWIAVRVFGGLTSLTTLAVSRAWRGVGVGSGVKGAVLWRSSGPLTPLPRPISLGRERSVMFFIELRSLTARFFGLGQSCMGLCSNCIVLDRKSTRLNSSH